MRLALLFVFLIIGLTASSQRFEAGVVAGAIASQLSGDQAAGYDKPGFEAGGFVSTPVNEKFSAGFQICYIQKGSRKTANPDIGDFTFYRCRLHYIQVPLVLEYHFSRKISFDGFVGIAVLLSQEEEDEYGRIYNRKEFNKWECTGGLSFNYLLFPNFQLLFGMENSVLPVRKNDGTEIYRLDRDQFNSLLRFAIRYKFKSQANAQP
jgi:hypothetical protein